MSCTAPVFIRRPASARLRERPGDDMMLVPCGRCVSCTLDYSRSWSVRCYHEFLVSSSAYFLTLTLDDDHIEFVSCGGVDQPYASLDPLHLSRFWQRLRDRGHSIRHFSCGEYGTRTFRPHYHSIVFGISLTDLKPLSRGLCESAFLDEVWGLGKVAIGSVTPESISYCCRYTTKKALGRPKQWYYDRGLYPEFVRMSRRPGIGTEFFKRFRGDIYNTDSCMMPSGFTAKVPRFYDKLLEATDPDFLVSEIKPARKERMLKHTKGDIYPDTKRNFARDRIARSKLELKSDIF